MEQKEKNDLICGFFSREKGQGATEGAGEPMPQKKKCCKLNCLQCKEGIYLLTIG